MVHGIRSLIFLVVLALCCCVWAFSSCGVQAPHCGGFSCGGARVLGARASVGAADRLSSCALLASRTRAQYLWHVGSSVAVLGSGAQAVVVARGLSCPRACGGLPPQTRGRTQVPCIGRWILIHRTAGKSLPNVHYRFRQECYHSKMVVRIKLTGLPFVLGVF